METTTNSHRFKLKDLPSLLKETFNEWNDDEPFRLSAVVAYYAILSLPALLIIIINTVGAVWGEEIVQGKLTDEISSALGNDAAESIRSIIANTRGGNKSTISTIIGIGTLIFGATGIFYQLQLSLNQIWDIKVHVKSNIKKLILDRARSFGFILVIGFLLLVSFILTTAISVLNGYISSIWADGVVYLSFVTDIVLSIGIISVLFALMFKYLPDAEIQWKTVWIGAIITACLFVLGKFLLGLYFGKADPGSTYGAAGSVILILLWVSYSCLILFFGAEFTFVYAKRYGIGIKPSSNAIRVEQKEVIIDEGEDSKRCSEENQDCEK